MTPHYVYNVHFQHFFSVMYTEYNEMLDTVMALAM